MASGTDERRLTRAERQLAEIATPEWASVDDPQVWKETKRRVANALAEFAALREEGRLTRAEWKREVALEQCSRLGHDLEIVVMATPRDLSQPRTVLCRRCGAAWAVSLDRTSE